MLLDSLGASKQPSWCKQATDPQVVAGEPSTAHGDTQGQFLRCSPKKKTGTVPSFSPQNTQGQFQAFHPQTPRAVTIQACKTHSEGRARSRSHTRCTPAPPEPLLPPSLKPHGSPRAPIPTKSTPNTCTPHVRVPCPQVSPTGRLSPAGCALPGPTSQANSGEVL